MISKKIKPTSIETYIIAAPEEVRGKLYQMHTAIIAAAPGAIESLKWNMPAYSYQRILVSFAVFKHHIGFYPTPSAILAFASSLTKYKSAKGSIQFPINKPLPTALIRKITRFRVKESLAADVKWKS